jgi:DNA-binding ferritin-like protein|tara:strand:+ start:428 stop:961 length:534 start_codon:yes stop_codon:yes gene_type:complete
MESLTLEDLYQQQLAAEQLKSAEPDVKDDVEAGVDELIRSLVKLASFLFHLNMQAHLLHLNVEAPFFLAVHKFLKKQYQEHQEDFDTLSEMVRSMDYLMPMCQKGLLGAYPEFKTITTYEAKESLLTYLKNLEDGGYMAKDIYELSEKVGAPDVSNALADVVKHMFKGAWMLKSTLR